MSLSLQVRAGQYTDAGVKEANEDSCGIRIPEEPVLSSKGVAIVIADGMSGSEAGKEASDACVTGFLSDYFSTPDSWTVQTSGGKILSALNRWLYGQGHQQYGTPKGMVTTLSAMVIKSTTAHLFHVGDTRIYRLRDGELECLTNDHRVFVGADKNYLNRAMGIELSMEIDYKKLPVEEGDRYLLTTDGVHDFVDDKILKRFLVDLNSDPEAIAQQIVAHGAKQRSDDNLTAQVLVVDALPSQSENEVYRSLTQLPFPPPLEAGMILDGYKILRELHASTRTQVYVALDQESNETVVLKTPSVNYEDDPHYIDQFLHEEWAGRRINNNHALRIKETTRNRQCLYYVTEFVEGRTLRQWMHDNPQPSLEEVREIMRQLASGLRAFHRQEMLHQDLKPENIIIDNHGTVKIIDFGSTKIAGIQEITTPLERDNLLGTRDYTAPEYLQGYAGTNRSDLYSVGVIAYEMLTGKHPYGGELTARNLKRAKFRSAMDHNPEVPAWMDSALEKALSLAPTRRYETLSEFIHDITQPNPDLVKTDYAPLMERNPLGFWRASAIALLLINLILLYKMFIN